MFVCVCGGGGHHSCLTNIIFYFLFSKGGKIDDFLLPACFPVSGKGYNLKKMFFEEAILSFVRVDPHSDDRQEVK